MTNTLIVGRRTVLSLAAGGCASLLLSRMAFAEELSPGAFQSLVIALGARRYPTLPMRPGPSSLEILWGDHHLYLNNAYALARTLPPEARERAVLEFIAHFSPEADAHIEAIRAKARDWATARALLRPKLFPMATVHTAPWLVTKALATSVAIGYAIDLGESDLYVDNRWLPIWCRPVGEIHEAALANLEEMSRKVAVPSAMPDAGVIVVATGDGYDAARILLPGLRTRLLEALGPQVMAGVPARDLFVAWSSKNTDRRLLQGRVHDIALRAPHAITDEIFAIDHDGIRPATMSEL